MSILNAQALIDTGQRRICPGCGYLVIATSQRCGRCGHTALSPAATRSTNSKAKPATASDAIGSATLTDQALGGMQTRPDRTLWIVSHGNPKPQGSMVALAAGKMKATDQAMYRWRDTITSDALRQTGIRWKPIDGPVQIDVAFTMPFPHKFEDQSGRIAPVNLGELPRIPAMQPPDRDKLLRAVQDALSPLDSDNKGGKESQLGAKRFKLVVDDARFVYGAEAKTYGRPGHTHAWALDRPGAVIRVSMIDADVEPMPRPTLGQPGALPVEASELHEQLLRRNRVYGQVG